MSDYNLQQDDQLEIIRVIVHGELTKDSGYEIITAARNKAAETGYGILYDVRNVVHRVSIADFFFLPRKLEALKNSPARHARAAVVISPEITGEYHFYENVTENVGLVFRVFLDVEEAIAWLKETKQG